MHAWQCRRVPDTAGACLQGCFVLRGILTKVEQQEFCTAQAREIARHNLTADLHSMPMMHCDSVENRAITGVAALVSDEDSL